MLGRTRETSRETQVEQGGRIRDRINSNPVTNLNGVLGLTGQGVEQDESEPTISVETLGRRIVVRIQPWELIINEI